jgi:hypothetical protein
LKFYAERGNRLQVTESTIIQSFGGKETQFSNFNNYRKPSRINLKLPATSVSSYLRENFDLRQISTIFSLLSFLHPHGDGFSNNNFNLDIGAY